jgi:hypothetical protein
MVFSPYWAGALECLFFPYSCRSGTAFLRGGLGFRKRLSVVKAHGRFDTLTFSNGWEVNISQSKLALTRICEHNEFKSDL